MGEISVMKLDKLQVAGVFADFSLSRFGDIYKADFVCA